MPDRTPGGVTTRTRRHARVAWSALMRALSDYALMAVPTSSDRHAEPSEYVIAGRRVALMAQEIKFVGVMLMLKEGKDWTDVAKAAGLHDTRGQPDGDAARAIYEEAYDRFTTGDRNPWRTPGIAGSPTDAYGDPDQLAARLDEWYLTRSGGDGLDIEGLRPVSDGLY